MVPNSNGAIFTSSYVYNTTQGVAAGTKYSQINYGDNLSLYMLDPNYTPLPGDTLTYSVGGVKVGRVLQALVGYTLTQGGASAQGDLLFSDGTMYNNGGGFTLDLALAKGTSWPQSNSTVSGVSLVRGNYYRTYVDYGLTNVYRTRPAYMPNGPNWLFQTTGNVDNSLGYFDGDGQGNSALVNFDIYTAGLTFAGSIGWGYDVDTPYANSSTVMFDLPRKPYAGGATRRNPSCRSVTCAMPTSPPTTNTFRPATSRPARSARLFSVPGHAHRLAPTACQRLFQRSPRPGQPGERHHLL